MEPTNTFSLSMRASLLSILAVAFFVLAGISSRAEDRRAPIYFTNELVAFTNGLKVLTAVKVADAKGKERVESLIGSRVLFRGNNSEAPHGTNADLNLGNGVLLIVELNPHLNIRLPGRMWVAEVVGVLKSVDFEHRIVHIKALPEEWKACMVR